MDKAKKNIQGERCYCANCTQAMALIARATEVYTAMIYGGTSERIERRLQDLKFYLGTVDTGADLRCMRLRG